MAKKVDWLYHRKHCVSCQRARDFLEAEGLSEVRDQADASKDRRGRDEAITLARAAKKVIVVKGKKIVTFDMKTDPPDDDTLAAHLIGPTGNLRAPTLRQGSTLLVGFNGEAYRDVLGTNKSSE